MWPFRSKSSQVSHAPTARNIRARYEAASPEHHRLFLSDGLSADAAASSGVRAILRKRCRAQVENDSLAEGIIDTLANDTIGVAPRLQMLTGSTAADDQIERAFEDWARAANLAEKLRIMRRARCTDGEIFAVLKTNPKLDSSVKLDVQLIE